jgi:hypothetical protein
MSFNEAAQLTIVIQRAERGLTLEPLAPNHC